MGKHSVEIPLWVLKKLINTFNLVHRIDNCGKRESSFDYSVCECLTMLEKIEKGEEITGHERFEIPETYTSSIYDSISKIFDYLADREKHSLDENALKDAVTYAEDCYIEHCEDLGTVAIEEIHEMESEIIQRTFEILKNIFKETSLSEEQQTRILENYKKEIKNDRGL